MKNMLLRGLLGLLLLTLAQPGHAQYVLDEYYQQGELRHEDHIYKAGIRTVKFHPENEPREMPIIKLNSGQRLMLTFDDLFEDYMELSYTVIHCNADWTPSSLMPQEYISSFQDLYVTEYDYSINALIPYTNYNLQLPNQDMQFLKSGNYLLKVYTSGNPDDLVLTRRFMVYESFVNIGAEVKRPTMVDYIDEYQEVDFTVSHPDYQIQNPFQDVTVYVLQNHRFDNAISDLKPQFLQNNQLIYQYDEENLFRGGNEFRFFDTKNLQSLTLNIRKIDRDSAFTVYLKKDRQRTVENYSVNFDINGQYVVRRLDATNSSTNADYAYIDFLLESPTPYKQSDVYLLGRFTDWKLTPEFRLKYDYARNAYHTRVLLKQGYYNFMYALYDQKNQEADITAIEGSHWETENTYQILVYHRQVGIRYDRLIGFGQFDSEDLY